ncbi:MAG: hypothetical protein KatS3mg095_0412 [Candidatus Parcubacteria bacterium]|nr:MAG: hypothetical protein KatS3mg095_0412 [Candidatus Parcubacteria bacterium]
MKQLAEIYIKHLKGEELTVEELRFLYEIDREIHTFDYQEDTRIKKILTKNKTKKHLAKIFNCQKTKLFFTIPKSQMKQLFYGVI